MSEASTSTTDTSTNSGSSTTVDPIEVNGGDTAVTFDDLERIDQQTKEAKKAEKDSVKQTVKEAVKELDKKGQKDEKSAKKADDKEESDEEDAGKKDAKGKLEKTGEKEKKSIRAKLGDGEIEIDPDAVLTVKVLLVLVMYWFSCRASERFEIVLKRFAKIMCFNNVFIPKYSPYLHVNQLLSKKEYLVLGMAAVLF